MKKEYVLYGLKKNEPDYMEELITSTHDIKKFNNAKEWAMENGFVKFRVATFNGEPPNFNNPELINSGADIVYGINCTRGLYD
tara:strand:- start:399 stop:647 length:249 start_codon:yes stop_codon:yes gene_type:complete